MKPASRSAPSSKSQPPRSRFWGFVILACLCLYLWLTSESGSSWWFGPTPAQGLRIRGKFDRFGRRGLASSGPFRHPLSHEYYHHEGAAKITKESRFEAEYDLGRKIAFLCTATGSPRPYITWLKDGVELYAHNWLQIHEWIESPEQIKSKMEIDPATQADEGTYECVADNKYAIDRRRFRTYYDEMDK